MTPSAGFMVDTRRFSKHSLDVSGKLNIRIHPDPGDNYTWSGYIEDPRRTSDDDIGALYYVVAVILIYGLSIVMMIASHIRKNKQDNQLRTYLKEMAKLRKDDRREKVLSKISDIAKSRQQQEAKQKLQQKIKDPAPDNEVDCETVRPLMTKEANEDTTDSVCVQPNCSISTESHSPSSSECQSSAHPGRGRSLSCHEGTRRKSNDSRVAGGPESKVLRLQQRRSSNWSDHKSLVSPIERRRSSINDFHLSPLCRRERSSTVQEIQPHRAAKPQNSSPSDSKSHKTSETKQYTQGGEIKPSWPASVHIVNEDSVL
ncbi:hypothetical protein BsWGS_19719 [Bradybaena similaris]